MDDKYRNNGRTRKRGYNPNSFEPGSFLDYSGTQTNASWFQEKEWFTVQDAAKVIRVRESQIHDWITQGKITATMRPMTEGNGEWLVHWSSVSSPPEIKTSPDLRDNRGGT